MKFKVGDRVKVTAYVNVIDCRENTACAKGMSGVVKTIEGTCDNCYYVGLPDGFSAWFSETELEGLPEQADTKPTNPKDAIGSTKIPLHLWPTTATVYGAMALQDGACKYGRNNWRAMGVRATVYIDAMQRHLIRYAAGEDIDPDSGLPQLAMVLACAAILVDAKEAGMLNDDREYPGGLVKLIERMTPHVARIKERYKDKTPHHYSIADAAESEDKPREAVWVDDTNLTPDPSYITEFDTIYRNSKD
jgi:hypothetical protein